MSQATEASPGRPSQPRVAARRAHVQRSPLILVLVTAGVLFPLCGCIVLQPRGEGTVQKIVEPTTKRPYYVYLPREYVQADEVGRAARRWPLVVTFHGMKPYDVASFQSQEWQQEADRYGFIVVAPVLTAFDFFGGEFPLRTINRQFKSDEIATLAILDHVFATTEADPTNVLSTSWSSGGYMAHYMLNRHPDRFTCLAVRQSNFSANVLDSTWTAQSLYHPILILSTQNDINVCKEESREAIRWYEGHGYKNFAWVYMNRLSHERTPDPAADFFAHVAGVTPNRPPEVLIGRQAIDGNTTGLALLAGKLGQMQKPPGTASEPYPVAPPPRPPAQRRPLMVAAKPATPASPGPGPIASPAPAAEGGEQPLPTRTEPTPRRIDAPARTQRTLSPLGIQVSSTVGFAPLLITYSAECPADWQRTAEFSWTLDGREISRGVNGQRTLAQAGDYSLEVLAVTKDGAQHRAACRIRVMRSAEATAVPAAGNSQEADATGGR